MERVLNTTSPNQEKSDLETQQNEDTGDSQNRNTKNSDQSNTSEIKENPNNFNKMDSLRSYNAQSINHLGEINGGNLAHVRDSADSSKPNIDIERNPEKISSKAWKIAVVIAFLGMAYIIQDIFTRLSFADGLSRDIIVHLQSSLSSNFLFNISIFLSDSSFVVTGVVILIIMIWGTNRLHTFYYLLTLASAASFLSILKLLYNDPRPYMVYDNVLAKQCATEYGEPSGHAMLNLFAGIQFVSLVMPAFPKKQKIICSVYGIYLFLVGLSRIHLGMHGVNQVILGWVYAIVLFCLFRIVFFSKLVEAMRQLSRISREKQTQPIIITVMIYLVLTFSVMGLFLGIRQTYEDSNNAWNAKIIAACSDKSIKDLETAYLYNMCYIDAGVFGAVFGVLLGMIMSRGSVDNCWKYGESNEKMNLLKKLKRFGAIIAIPGILFLSEALIFNFISNSMIQVRYFLYLNLIPGVCAFIAVYFSPLFLQKLKLDVEGDFLRLQSESPQTDYQNQPAVSEGMEVASFSANKQELQQTLITQLSAQNTTLSNNINETPQLSQNYPKNNTQNPSTKNHTKQESIQMEQSRQNEIYEIHHSVNL